MGAYRAGMLDDYLQNQWVNMPPMDISMRLTTPSGPTACHVGTDRCSGRACEAATDQCGGGYVFLCALGDRPLTVVAADGMPVQPFARKRLLMGMGETYDVVTVPDGGW